MSKEGYKNTYSAEHIRKYLDGELSDPEMQALEKAALEDPFLADAIEGLEESRKHSVSFESSLADLQKRLSDRIHRKKKDAGVFVLFSKWQTAAAIVLVLGLAVYSITYLNDKTRPADIAISSKKDSRPDSAGSLPEKIVSDTSATSIRRTENDNRSAAKRIQKKVRSEKQITSEDKKVETIIRKDSTPMVESREAAQELNSKEKTMRDTTSETKYPSGFAARDVVSSSDQEALKEMQAGSQVPGFNLKNIASRNYIKGTVIDDKGKPLPNAAISSKGAVKPVFTDNSGFFKLYMKNPAYAALILVHPQGYEPFSAELNTDSTIMNTIQMQSGGGSLNKIVPLEFSRTDTVTGWHAFIEYIDTNKRINSADSVLKGDEIISFFVYPDGKLSSFKVEKSVSPAHDMEIMRLIKIAPPISTGNGKKKRCRLNIRFK
jgi:hypothetical protein